jgi:hypothetical protein
MRAAAKNQHAYLRAESIPSCTTIACSTRLGDERLRKISTAGKARKITEGSQRPMAGFVGDIGVERFRFFFILEDNSPR